jgi:nucleotide-binding universal stress UspA family protein
MRILLAIDGSTCSDNAVEEVALRPWPEGSEIRVVTAYEMPLPATPEGWSLPASYFNEIDAALRGQAKSIIERAVSLLRSRMSRTISVDGDCLIGSPRSVILDEAKSWNADLIVVGSHGYGAWGRFLLGSVSQSVVSHAKCSVEVVRGAPVRTPDPTVAEDEVRQHG